jgi:flavin-dependent dehydrogenase
MAMSDFSASRPDVAIIGGGPAGAAAARMLASWGHRVVLIARSADPARGFAESLPPSTETLLAEIGVLEALRRSDCIRTSGNTVWWGGREGARETFQQDGAASGYQVCRPEFDRLLLDHAAGSGADIWRDAVVTAVGSAPDGVNLEVAGPDRQARRVSARYVIDCSGRAGVVARRGWRRYDRAFRGQALIGVWQSAAALPVDPGSRIPSPESRVPDPDSEVSLRLTGRGDTLVESFADGWGWSVPSTGAERHVGVIVDAGVTGLPRGRRFDETYLRVLRRLPRLSGILAGARFDRAWACDASVYDASCCADGQVLIAGDAASFIEPLSSFGVKKALASAWTAAVAVHTSLVHPDRRAAALGFFAAWEQRVYASARARSIEYAGEAHAHHRSPFWAARAATGGAAESDPAPDDGALLGSPDVPAAHEALRAAASCVLVESALELEPQPIIVGHEIELQDGLVLDGVARPVRFVRGVDLLGLVSAARGRTDAGAIVASYLNRHRAPVPDILAALSLLVARGVLCARGRAVDTQT